MRHSPQTLAVVALLAAAALPHLLLAQGSLTPPGAPAVSMKTLSQVEPRIPIDTVASAGTGRYGITAPGSYYLTSDISRGASACVIEIQASNVTIDLNGFRIVETTGPSPIIRIERAAQRSNIVIKNGTVEAPALTFIALTGSTNFVNNLTVLDVKIRSTDGAGTIGNLSNMLAPRFERVQITNCNGPLILLAAGSEASGTIKDCSSQNGALTPFTGNLTVFQADSVINCTVNGAQASGNATGIAGNSIRGCTVINVGTSAAGQSIGINATNVIDCNVRTVGSASTGTGTAGIVGMVVRGCFVSSLGSSGSTGNVTGIGASSLVEDCMVTSLNGAATITGINATVANRCTANTVTQAAAAAGLTATGISGRLTSNCFVFGVTGSGTGAATGINSGTITACRVSTVANAGAGEGNGIAFAEAGGRATDCSVNITKNHGVSVGFSGQVLNCVVAAAGGGAAAGVTDGAGIFVNAADVRVEGCSVSNTDHCVRVAAGFNVASVVIVRNSSSNCTTDFVTQANNRVGDIVTGGGTVPAATTAWANFTD